MNDDQIRAIAWVRDHFPRWEVLKNKVRAIEGLLMRKCGTYLYRWRGWETFEDGLREHLADMPPRQVNALVKWISAQPLSALATA